MLRLKSIKTCDKCGRKPVGIYPKSRWGWKIVETTDAVFGKLDKVVLCPDCFDEICKCIDTDAENTRKWG